MDESAIFKTFLILVSCPQVVLRGSVLPVLRSEDFSLKTTLPELVP